MGIALAAVAVAVTGIAWMQEPDPVSARDAVAVAGHALTAAGVEATVDRHPAAGEYQPTSGDPVPVWEVQAALPAGAVDLWIARDDGQAVFLDDRTDDGTGQLLTDAQVAAVGGHRSNPALARQVRRNVLVTVAALLVAVVALWAARHRSHLTSPRPAHPPTEERTSP
ncbi:MAG TPA: hypothetical protein VFV32_15245 [Acidimicrobiales bacterium]|nr:hypothetical protein [Acidimicrobiales bacterium]